MNRTIFLGVPPLEEKDLQETAEEIASNLDKEISMNYKDLFSNLVKTYWEYKNEIKSTNQSEFHGLRDFYHLIKNAMNYLMAKKKNKKIENNYILNSENKNEIHEEEDNDDNDINNTNNININEESYEIGIKSLKRNFDGLKDPFNSFDKIKKIFNKFYNNINIDEKKKYL